MSLLSLRDISFTWGGPQLLDGVSMEIERGERIGLLGRNGSGKSTLMKIVAGELAADHGEVRLAAGARVARLIQEVPREFSGTIAEIARAGCPDQPEWEADQAVNRVLSRMNLDGQTPFATLSSGMKRRALLAQALAGEPDVLLLDEPTNHLDIESIAWLERFLKGFSSTLVFVTHDRQFLQSLASRILEIDRGRLFDWSCDYQTFLQRKAAALEAERQQNDLFDRKLAEEERWIRQGIKARRTRNEGRVRALKKMREEHRQRRQRVGSVRLQAVAAERSGQLVLEATDVSFAYQDSDPIIRDVSVLITRGEKIGVVGPNGSGKSTLLKLLLGELTPTAGSLRHGTRLEVLYFDQLRQQIDDEQTVIENVGEGQETLQIHGKQKHIYGYLQDFLFTPERARLKAKFLSGGERNRVLLARLFKRSSNTLVLDEPTNDLDIETLELLEELVADYQGTLLLVSHDRAFLNNVVTSTLAVEGDGQVRQYAGGYDDYLLQRPAVVAEQQTPGAGVRQDSAKPVKSRNPPAKLSYKQQRELDELPERIEQLEQQIEAIHETMADPGFYKGDGGEIAATSERLSDLQEKLRLAYERWEELDEF